MPRRAKPGDRAAIEEALGPEFRAQLRDIEEMFQLRPGSWQKVAHLEALFTTTAVILESGRIQVSEGVSERIALERVARRFRIPIGTIRARLNRWFSESYRDEPF